MQRLLYLSEQHQRKVLPPLSEYLKSVLIEPTYEKFFPHKKDKIHCFVIRNEGHCYTADSKYFIGADWLVPKLAAVYVEPKLNDETEEVDFLRMLFDSLKAPENFEHLDGLFHVDYDQPWITIPHEKDFLSPILIVQFLKLTQKIVKKGLKRSYYRVTENLNSKIKGKILVGHQIKENVVKNRLTKTVCNYQEHGVNTLENQFLKLVLEFVSSYIYSNNRIFNKQQHSQLSAILHYCSPAFQQVDTLSNAHQKFSVNKNPFYREYEDAIIIGGYILKRFSFNVTKTSTKQTETPPFWIDMSKLFELYVFQKLKKIFPDKDAVTYHDPFLGGKETDILIRAEGYQCVIDCKYKPRYKDNTPSLEDKRQLAGYTRMRSVYDKLSIPYDKVVKGIIVYSNQNSMPTIYQSELFDKPISEYVDFYKVGISLPKILR